MYCLNLPLPGLTILFQCYNFFSIISEPLSISHLKKKKISLNLIGGFVPNPYTKLYAVPSYGGKRSKTERKINEQYQ